MVSTRKTVPAVRMAGLAVILVLSGLVPVIPEAEAQASLSVLAGPYFVPDLPARGSCTGGAVVLARPADRETQVQSVQIQSAASGSINQIKFIYDVVADPGSATAPGLSHALLWNEELSGGAGWTAQADNGNAAATGTLEFRGPNPGANVPIGTVVRTGNGIEFVTTQAGALGPAQQAVGNVTFTKNPSYNGTVTVPVGTVVRTASGVEFRTTVPAQWASGSRTVQVIALVGGAQGNVPANSIVVLGSSVQGVQSVTNPQAFTSGRNPYAQVSARAVYPGLTGNVDANSITQFRNTPPSGVTNVTNPQAMDGGKALTAGTQRVLTFTAQPGTALTGGPGAVFTFAFQIPSSAQGDANGATPYSYPIRISTTGPSATDARFCIRMDNTPPKILTAVTRDADADGRLDLMELTFDEALHKDSLIHNQFQVKTLNAERPYSVLATSPPLESVPCGFNPENTPDRNKILEITPERGSSSPCPRRVILRLSAGPNFDTGDLPAVTYPAPNANANLTDLAGNKLATFGLGAVNTTDGAKPVLVSALARDGSNRLVITFSEPVQGRGGATTSPQQQQTGPKPLRMDGPDCQSNCLSDFVYLDGCWPPAPNAPSPPPCPNDPNLSGSNVGSGDCVGVDAPSGTRMPRQFVTLEHSTTTDANRAIIRLEPGSAQYPGRYPKAWGDPSQQGWIQPGPGTNGCNNGQFGAGDTHKSFGDRLGIAIDESGGGGLGCVDTQRKIYDFAPCDTVIKDNRGLRAIGYKGSSTVRVTGVYITEAEVNIASFRLTLKFNGPVESAQSSQGRRLGLQLTDLDVVSTDDTGQGPGGILSINHTAGSDQAVLSLDRPARPTDVDDTPSRIRVSCAAGRGIKAFGLDGVFVPCADPDADNRPDVGMVDRTPPAFTPRGNIPALTTVDANRNGYIDGIKVYFSEPIDDSSFCMGPTTVNHPLPPVRCMGDGLFDEGCDDPETHSILIVNNIPGPYTWDTDLLPDDDQGIIRFPETPGRLQTTGYTPAITTNPCWTADSGAQHYMVDVNCGGTAPPTPFCGARRGTGLFADQFHPQPSNPPYLFANHMKRVCGEQFGGGTQRDVPPCIVGAGESGGITARVFDGAPPVLWSAKTIDTPRTTIHCAGSQTRGCEGDGFIDGYVLTFSEPVNDCSFRASEWKVARHNVTGMRTNLLLSGYNAICPAPRYPPQGQGDTRIVVTFDQARNPDTDAKPELTYTGPSCPSCGLRDLNGNAMAAFGTLAITEEDDAPPVIYCVRGFIGRDEVTVEFSEPVDNGEKGALTRSDFIFSNGNPEAFSGASGMSGTVQVKHQPGSRTAIVTLNEPLTHGDHARDTFAAHAHSIVEVSPTVAVKKAVSTVPHNFCRGVDEVPPGAVQNLQVVAGLTSANSVTLSWLAPGNDDPRISGEPNGNVTGYKIKVSTEPITLENVGSTTAAGHVALLVTNHDRDPSTCLAANGTIRLECVPACRPEIVVPTGAVNFARLSLRMTPLPCELAHPGNVQRATITGLNPETTYHFAILAFDNATDRDGNPRPNTGPMGAPVETVTGKDGTPPTPAPVIYTDGIRPYQPQFNKRPTFKWTPSNETESTVVYAYRVTPGDDDYVIECATDAQTTGLQHTPTTDLADGLHTFHVAACSPGGQTTTAHYTVRVGHAEYDADKIFGINKFVATRPYRLGSQYIVNWTLPPEAQIAQALPGAVLEAVEIYRLTDDPSRDPRLQRELAHTVRGTYETLRQDEWIDESYPADDDKPVPYYRVEMVFAKEQRQNTAPEETRDFAQPIDQTPRPSPLPWLIGTILLAAALAAVVAWAILASRKSAAARQAKEEAPAGLDPETGLPTHDVKCPTCSTPFQAVGALPLQITCPSCGATGLLQ